MRAPAALLAVAASLAACGSSGDRAVPAAEAAPCTAPTIDRQSFRHTLSGKLGDGHHGANDVVIAVDRPYQLRAKFSYGPLLKDLEDEDVALIVGDGDCGPWQTAETRRTNDDGWVTFERPAHPRAMVRPFHLMVPGDGSALAGRVYAVTPGTAAVLFDIDGTLTTGDGELLEDLLGGEAPDMRAGAPAVAKRWADLGYLVVYITGRVYALRGSTRRWLTDRGFPPGPVFTVERTSDAMPGGDHVGVFKRSKILALMGEGLHFEAAYGNASTDVCAYAEAGIAPTRTWITETDQPACPGHDPPHPLPSYVDHLPTLASQAPAPDR